MQKATHDLFRNIEEFEKSVIAAINGVALGGGLEIALCCDIRLAASTARIGLPEIKHGVIPAAGGTQRLPRLIGEARAKELILTADLIDAETALRYGIVSGVLEPDQLMLAAMELAQRIAEHPPLAVRFAKRAINRGMQTDLDSGLEFERYAAAMIMDSEDRKEGMRAFVEKSIRSSDGRGCARSGFDVGRLVAELGVRCSSPRWAAAACPPPRCSQWCWLTARRGRRPG